MKRYMWQDHAGYTDTEPQKPPDIFVDGPCATGFSFSLYASSFIGCSPKLVCSGSSGLILRTAYLLILITALKSLGSRIPCVDSRWLNPHFRGVLQRLPSVPFGGLSAVRAPLAPRRSAAVSPTRSSEVHSTAHPSDYLFLQMNVLIHAHR